MSLEIHNFAFGEFLLDPGEKVLWRDGKPVTITPKAFELLLILVKNHGHLVEKSDLLNAVWTDSFVEEGNIAFTIQQLRRILQDDAHHPTYIETIPRRGYRFIAPVREISRENQAAKNGWLTSPKIPVSIIGLSILLVGLIAIGSRYLQSKDREPTIPLLSTPFSAEKLSTNGKVWRTVISPDGKNVVYATGNLGSKQSVWLRQLETGNNVEIISPSDGFYHGLALSPDGNFLYFARGPQSAWHFDIYRVSIFGGVPTRILSETKSGISLSPDGKKISFVRCPRLKEENCSLLVADALDGKNERKLVSRPFPLRIGDNKFSPDGKTIAFAVGQSANQANEFSLTEVNLESGAESELTQERFFDIKSLVWLPDQSGLLITASRIPNKNFGIWQVSAASGEAQILTKDSESYSALSLDKEGTWLIATQAKEDFRLELWSLEKPSNPRYLADATKVAFAPNGKIVFISSMTDNDEVWLTNPDGSGRQQLTNNKADENFPIVSRDNNYIFFASNLTGEAHVWRMNADGSNQIQITRKEGGFPFFASPDGKWLYYHHGLYRTIWRVMSDGQGEELVFDRRMHFFAVSPGGDQIALPGREDTEKLLTIVSLNDQKTVRTFPIADQKANLTEICWMPDNRGIVYILKDSEEKNTLWLQEFNGALPRKLTDLGNQYIAMKGLAVAPDGKNLAVVQGGWQHDSILIKGLK